MASAIDVRRIRTSESLIPASQQVILHVYIFKCISKAMAIRMCEQTAFALVILHFQRYRSRVAPLLYELQANGVCRAFSR